MGKPGTAGNRGPQELKGPDRRLLGFVFLCRGSWRLGVHHCYFLSQEMGLVGSEATSWRRPATDLRIAPTHTLFLHPP